MKKLLFSAILVLCIGMLSACGSKNGSKGAATSVDSIAEVGPYTVELIGNNTYHIQDFNTANPAGEKFDENGELTHFNNCSDMYLIVGSKRALLIDLSNYVKWDDSAVESLRKLVYDRCADKTLIITFTHNHGDHTGMLPAFVDDKKVIFALPRIDFEAMADRFPHGQYYLYDEAHFFDLGDMKINSLMVPGHTHGSMVFFDPSQNFVYTGDAIGSGHGVWIFNAEGFKEYTIAVSRLIQYIQSPISGLKPEEIKVWGGHYWQKDMFVNSEDKDVNWQYLLDMRLLIGQILTGLEYSEPSNLNHKHLDTYFRYKNAIIVWNKAEAEEYVKNRHK